MKPRLVLLALASLVVSGLWVDGGAGDDQQVAAGGARAGVSAGAAGGPAAPAERGDAAAERPTTTTGGTGTRTGDGAGAGGTGHSGGEGPATVATVATSPTNTHPTPPPPPRHPTAPPRAPSRAVQQPQGWRPAVDATGGTDVSAAMAEFLAEVPDGATISLQPGGRYRMESTWLVESRRSLTILGNGATFVATTPGDLMRANIRIARSSGITIRDLKVVGANPTAGAKDRTYRPERGGQHGIDVNSSRDVALVGITVTDTYGDFVYLGQRDGGTPTEGVLIQASTFARSGRQGITLTAARNVVIETSSISQAKRSTFDFEPGRGAGMSVQNVTIRDNRVSDGPLLFVAAEGHGPVDDIRIQRNRLTNMTLNIAMEDLDGGVRRRWSVLDNVGDLRSGNPYGATMRFRRVIGLEVRGNRQSMKPGRNMVGVGAVDSCGVNVSGNTFPDSVGQLRMTGTC